MSPLRIATARRVRACAVPARDSMPRVVLVGGSDVDARLELMYALNGTVHVSALGSQPALREKFQGAGFCYGSYTLSRRANPVLDLLTLGQLAFIFRRWRPHIVHAFDTKPSIWACLAARLAGVPVVLGTVTGLGILYAPGGVSRRITRRAFEILQRLTSHVSDATIFQNPDDARQFLVAGIVPAHKAVILPGSGVDTARFDRAQIPVWEQRRVREELEIRPGEIVVTMIARVIRSKGVPEFARAAQEIRAVRPYVRFVLVGAADGGADRLDPVELAHLRRAVTWPGPRPDIPAVLAVSDVFVLPTVYPEGIPRVLLEAASMEIPIVTTDAPGCREAVEHGVTGFLVPRCDPAALRSAILRLVEEPDLRQRFGKMARQRAVARFDLKTVGDRTRALYQHLLEQKGLWGSLPAAGGDVMSAPHDVRGRRSAGIKRIFDVLFSVGVLLVTWPAILIGILTVALTSPGPAFYRAKRAGLGGRPFTMFKLRTMRIGPDAPDRRITEGKDDRITPVGRVLRKFQIDELPQFWNVLRGEMSVVGPRAEDWDIVRQHYTSEQRRTLDVRPGIVSPADITWYPNLTYHDPPPPGISAQEYYLQRHMPLQLAECLRYVEHQSLLLDLKVIGQTAFCVLVQTWLPPRRKPVSALPGSVGASRVLQTDRGEA
jgi:lipopolysaccharide/colanic/teichoic acid biosynthesis glycosyltransferase/glycosyltransferase involved in cell wall biosynthesis